MEDWQVLDPTLSSPEETLFLLGMEDYVRPIYADQWLTIGVQYTPINITKLNSGKSESLSIFSGVCTIKSGTHGQKKISDFVPRFDGPFVAFLNVFNLLWYLA